MEAMFASCTSYQALLYIALYYIVLIITFSPKAVDFGFYDQMHTIQKAHTSAQGQICIPVCVFSEEVNMINPQSNFNIYPFIAHFSDYFLNGVSHNNREFSSHWQFHYLYHTD